MIEFNIHQLPEIEHPKNTHRSNTAWRAIGYRPRGNEMPIGAVKGEYKRYYAVWDDTQVEPIPGKTAEARRIQYHQYLFRRRVWEKHHEYIQALNAENPDSALMFVADLINDVSLWKMGVLLAMPRSQHLLDMLIVGECQSSEKPSRV